MRKSEKIVIILLAILIINGIFALSYNQGLIVNVLHQINIHSPIKKIYTTRMIPLNISLNYDSEYISYSINDGMFTILCKNCDEYGYTKLRKKPFDDGFNKLTFLTIADGLKKYQHVNFTVDTHEPRITKIFPTRSFANGSFSVEFDEENPTNVILKYGYVGNIKNEILDINSCYNIFRSRTKCDIIINISEFNNKNIFFSFIVKDIVNNTVESKKIKIKVDFTPPIINSFDYRIEKKRVTFRFNITEPNFDKLKFIDLNAKTPTWKTLCLSLNKGICEKTKIFLLGNHELVFEIIDDAGNKINKNLEFIIS